MLSDLSDILLFLDTCEDEPELKQAHLGNTLALLKSALGESSWVGLYLATPTRLLLGPFQGTHACEIIQFGKGVVGTCYSEDKTITVEDVSAFPGYICCDASAKSEICIPVHKDGKVAAILDIDLPDYHMWVQDEIAILEIIATYLPRFL